MVSCAFCTGHHWLCFRLASCYRATRGRACARMLCIATCFVVCAASLQLVLKSASFVEFLAWGWWEHAFVPAIRWCRACKANGCVDEPRATLRCPFQLVQRFGPIFNTRCCSIGQVFQLTAAHSGGRCDVHQSAATCAFQSMLELGKQALVQVCKRLAGYCNLAETSGRVAAGGIQT